MDAIHEPTPDDRLRDAWAAESDEAQCAALVAGANPHLNLNGAPLIHHAALGGHIQTVRQLISMKADLNAKDGLGLTAAMKLAWLGRSPQQIEALRLLIAAGADLSVKSHLGLTGADLQPLTALDLAKCFPDLAVDDLLKAARAPRGRSAPPARDGGWKSR